MRRGWILLTALVLVGLKPMCCLSQNNSHPSGWTQRLAVFGGLLSHVPCGTPDQNVVIFEDEFDQGALDTYWWKAADAHHAANAKETDEFNSLSNLLFSNANSGSAIFRADARDTLGYGEGWEPATKVFDDGWLNWRNWQSRSAAIETKWNFTYGKFLIRAQIPDARFTWPAFWLFGDCGDEIDIFEFQEENNNHLHCRKISLSVHSKLQDCLPSTSQNTDTENKIPGIDFCPNPHVFGVEWDPWRIVFTIDGQKYRTFYRFYDRVTIVPGLIYSYQGIESCGPPYPNGTIMEDPQFSDAMMNIRINLAVRKDQPGLIKPAQFTEDFTVDWFRFLEPMDCDQEVIIRGPSDLVGLEGQAAYGDRTVTAGTIRVEPFPSIQINSAPIYYNPGGMLILTAAEEISIIPGGGSFDVNTDGNFIAQIRPCLSNKALDEFSQVEPAGPGEIFFDTLGLKEGTFFTEIANDIPHLVDSIAVFPNPSNTGHFEIKGLEIGDRLEVLDGLGRSILAQEVRDDFSGISLEASGVFLLTVHRGNQTKKISRLCVVRE